jgi:hypothetical protein
MRQRFDWDSGPAALSIEVDTSSDTATLVVTESATAMSVFLTRDQLFALAAGEVPAGVGLAVTDEGRWTVRLTATTDGVSVSVVVDRAELAHTARHLANLGDRR